MEGLFPHLIEASKSSGIILGLEAPSWRKKWEKVWHDVKYCSKHCSSNKNKK